MTTTTTATLKALEAEARAALAEAMDIGGCEDEYGFIPWAEEPSPARLAIEGGLINWAKTKVLAAQADGPEALLDLWLDLQPPQDGGWEDPCSRATIAPLLDEFVMELKCSDGPEGMIKALGL